MSDSHVCEDTSDHLFRQSITTLPRISDKRKKMFAKLGVETVGDLIWLMPRLYNDWSQRIPVGHLVGGDVAAFEAVIESVPSLTRRGKLSYIRARLSDDTGSIRAVWFNQPWLSDRLKRGDRYIFRGKIEGSGRACSVNTPEIRALDDESPMFTPVYPLTAGLSQATVRQAIEAAFSDRNLVITESLPAEIRSDYRLATADFALRKIHFPESEHDIEVARRRLAFEELFLLIAGLRYMKAGRREECGPNIELTQPVLKRLKSQIDRLPYSLTSSQESAIESILNDFRLTYPANRLIQGDVGSGKTVVAAMAMAVAAWSGFQSVMMAPTTILASQHAESVASILEGSGLSIALLTGGVTAARKRLLIDALAEGEIDILIGTHAVIEKDVQFAKLGCCVTDEQHRFGVRQRIKLSGDGDIIPHMLVMSATPIPRTLALILYGELDITEMKDMPSGRKDVKTYTATSRDRSRIDRLIERETNLGHQVFVVCPMIEESPELTINSAETVFDRLSRLVFPDRRVALMHGKLKVKEKSDVMREFDRGDIDILVSTTVIEVGIDQPNATLLIVENAERFGLSQLHQLRGRVGRSLIQSYCVLVSDSEDPLVRRRLTALCRNSSGFAIAEEDLLLRGPGDVFGVQQHGLPDFRVANLYEDSALLKEASNAAEQIVRVDPHLINHETRVILTEFKARYGDRLARPGL
ncbi:MAG TPA: ATP-dependent DNA helicase RecG [Clostridiaceae bacterium]|nr:ATP-dependent DNA helicase RecG [Clostridiaceae bacterium]